MRAVIDDVLRDAAARQIAMHPHGGSTCVANLPDHPVRRRRIRIPMHGDVGSLQRKGPADGRTDAAAGAGDQYQLVPQIVYSQHGWGAILVDIWTRHGTANGSLMFVIY